MLELLQQPWPWYLAGVLIGLTVPLLLLVGNKSFGISSSLRHICAMCVPAGIPFFKYEWKHEAWNLFFTAGLVLGGIIAGTLLADPNPPVIAAQTRQELAALGVTDFNNLIPSDLFGIDAVFSMRGLFFTIFGGLMVGFGTRYAGGCTSGHSIMGLSALQWPSLVATFCFMAGGFLMTHVILPILFQLF